MTSRCPIDPRFLTGPNDDPNLTAPVTLFKPSGKYYTSECWRIPVGAIGPYDMEKSPNGAGGPGL